MLQRQEIVHLHKCTTQEILNCRYNIFLTSFKISVLRKLYSFTRTYILTHISRAIIM